jgi:hypothetical protein
LSVHNYNLKIRPKTRTRDIIILEILLFNTSILRLFYFQYIIFLSAPQFKTDKKRTQHGKIRRRIWNFSASQTQLSIQADLFIIHSPLLKISHSQAACLWSVNEILLCDTDTNKHSVQWNESLYLLIQTLNYWYVEMLPALTLRKGYDLIPKHWFNFLL